MTAQEVLALRVTLLRAGYAPIPLFGKVPPAYGKNNARKGLGRWQTLGDVSDEQIEMWAQTWPDAINTGVLTRLTPALDLDLLNGDAAAAAEDYVRERFEEGGYVLTRIGRAPKRAILFRTQEPFAKIVANLIAPNGSVEKIEFLADGHRLPVLAFTRRPSGRIRHKVRPARSREDLPISARPRRARWLTGWPRCWSKFAVRAAERPRWKRAALIRYVRHTTALQIGNAWSIASVPAKGRTPPLRDLAAVGDFWHGGRRAVNFLRVDGEFGARRATEALA
jgi:hypothetical protein